VLHALAMAVVRLPMALSISGSAFFGGLKPRPIKRSCSSSVLTAWEGISVTFSTPLKIPVTTRGLPSESDSVIGVCPALVSALATHWGNEWGATSTSDFFSHIGSHAESTATKVRRHSVRGTIGLYANLHFGCAQCEPGWQDATVGSLAFDERGRSATPAQLVLDYRSQKGSNSSGYGCRGLCVCDLSGDAKLDLRTRVSLTPNVEATAKAFAALPHSGKSPVAAPLTMSEDLGIHTYSIIAHADGEIGIAKRDFGPNMAGLCMLVRVADRFACDAISLVTNDGSQLAGPALHDYAVLRL
jgi:hypothetical protein